MSFSNQTVYVVMYIELSDGFMECLGVFTNSREADICATQRDPIRQNIRIFETKLDPNYFSFVNYVI